MEYNYGFLSKIFANFLNELAELSRNSRRMQKLKRKDLYFDSMLLKNLDIDIYNPVKNWEDFSGKYFDGLRSEQILSFIKSKDFYDFSVRFEFSDLDESIILYLIKPVILYYSIQVAIQNDVSLRNAISDVLYMIIRYFKANIEISSKIFVISMAGEPINEDYAEILNDTFPLSHFSNDC